MAPARGPNGKEVYVHEIERTPEYADFIQKLQAFHEKRGTSFEAEPRLPTMHGHVNVDLYRLYKAVIEKGGYDEMNKVQKAWGVLAGELGMYYSDSKGMGQLSFQLKQDFYRYLAAFWIQDQHHKEPPPKEILEQQSCASKFGPVLTRTLENFRLQTRQSEATPTKEEKPAESTPTSANRASGRLREAPPQRVPFQPETGPSRQSRPHTTSHQGTPTANHVQQHPHHTVHHPQNHHHLNQQHNPSNPLHVIQAQQAALRGASSSFIPSNPETASRLEESVDLRPQISVPLRPVNTPGNNPVEFARRQQHMNMQSSGTSMQSRGPLPPWTGHEGPNIYTRCLQSLRSGIPAEQAFALNHLVKISFERGDKYKFESFLGLAEGLIEKGLEIGNLFYHVDWTISYAGDQSSYSDALDGENGTHDILERIERLEPKVVLDHIQPAHLGDRLLRIVEAVLTMRNMVMLVENAIYMAEQYPLKDLLCIILHLPNLEMLVEIKHIALDIAEQITPWLVLESTDPLYRTLLAQLDSADRGVILTALRAISRISMNLDATNMLQNVPPKVLQNIKDWLLLNDEELMDACLDFLYQYTAVVANVESLLKAVNMENVVPHLVRLLAHGAKRVKEERILEPERKAPCTEEVPQLPVDLLQKLVNTNEPDRCFNWLQSLFEEDAESHITQIAIWQAYQGSFGTLASGARNTLSAADFIRNVSHVFVNARAQIIRGPGEVQRFIIEGIRARIAPIHYDTKEEYSRCQWQTAKGTFAKTCNQFFLNGDQMLRHIMANHLNIPIETGEIKNIACVVSCDWMDCNKYPTLTKLKLCEISHHIRTHVPSSQKRPAVDGLEAVVKKQRKSYITPAKTMNITWEQTVTTRDERNPKIEQAAGIPLSAVLVLRNIARNVVKTESDEELRKQKGEGGEGEGWNERLFRPLMNRLFEIMTENKALSTHITYLIQLVESVESVE